MKARHAAFLGIFLVGALLRSAALSRPIDRAWNLWREADIASIARNFDREGMDLAHPRVDWRGDGPGYVEMELPAYPWAIAWLHRLFGLDEAQGGRLLAFLCSLVALGALLALAHGCLPEVGALAASAFFALNPLAVEVSHLLLADGPMFALYVVAVLAFVTWMRRGAWSTYVVALAATAGAILAKAPAAHLGLLFAWLALSKHGWAAFRRPALWALAALSLLPSALWYSHAYRLWATYGNSLGVSNEHHWIGLDMLSHPSSLAGILWLDVQRVWTPAGIVLVVVGVWYSLWPGSSRLGVRWLTVVAIYYLATARTTGYVWGVYYHVVAAAPVALLVGAGVQAVVQGLERARRVAGPRRLVASALLLPVLLSIPATGLWELRKVHRELRDWVEDPLHACARQFEPMLPPRGLLVASGGSCRDSENRLLAGNKPYMFYWLDRKGFTLCRGDQAVDRLLSFARRGATSFVAEKWELGESPGFEGDLRKAFPVLAECDAALLVELPTP